MRGPRATCFALWAWHSSRRQVRQCSAKRGGGKRTRHCREAAQALDEAEACHHGWKVEESGGAVLPAGRAGAQAAGGAAGLEASVKRACPLRHWATNLAPRLAVGSAARASRQQGAARQRPGS